MEFTNCLARREVGVDRRAHDVLSARDGLRQGLDAHPADHGIEGNEFLQVWLIAHNGFAVSFRCRTHEILVEGISPRHFAGELPFPRLDTLAQPSCNARCQAADNRSGKRR